MLLLASLLFAPACSDDEEPPQPTENAVGGKGAAGMGGADSGKDSAARYFQPDHVLQVSVELEPKEWDALCREKRSVSDIILGSDCQSAPFPNPFTWKAADVTIDGVSRKQVGLRKKGFLGSLSDERPSLKIAIDQFSSQDLFGVKDFTFNNVQQDPAIIGECLAFEVFAKAGVKAPRCNFAHVTVNGRDLGVYAHVEPIKKPFLRRHFEVDSGDLYEGTLSDFRDGWLGTFEPKTDETDPSRAPLEAIAKALLAPDSELVGQLRSVLDLDALLTTWAAEVALSHVDGYSRNTNNYYAYYDPESRHTTLIPWGADLVFGNGDSSANTADPMRRYTQGAIVHALYANTEGRELLLEALRDFLTASWDEAELVSEATRMANLVRPYLDTNRRSEFDEAALEVVNFVKQRRAALEATMQNPPDEPQPLRGPACLEPIGSVAGTFVTTWGTAGSADPFVSGDGTLDVTVRGAAWQHHSGYIGCTAGQNRDSSANQDTELVIPGVRTDGLVSIMAFGFDAADAFAGPITFDLEDAPGVLLETNPTVEGSLEVVGVVVGGGLFFEQFGTEPGSPVVGHFSGVLYSTPFLNGF